LRELEAFRQRDPSYARAQGTHPPPLSVATALPLQANQLQSEQSAGSSGHSPHVWSPPGAAYSLVDTYQYRDFQVKQALPQQFKADNNFVLRTRMRRRRARVAFTQHRATHPRSAISAHSQDWKIDYRSLNSQSWRNRLHKVSLCPTWNRWILRRLGVALRCKHLNL